MKCTQCQFYQNQTTRSSRRILVCLSRETATRATTKHRDDRTLLAAWEIKFHVCKISFAVFLQQLICIVNLRRQNGQCGLNIMVLQILSEKFFLLAFISTEGIRIVSSATRPKKDTTLYLAYLFILTLVRLVMRAKRENDKS